MRVLVGLAGLVFAAGGAAADAQMKAATLDGASRAVQEAYPMDAVKRNASAAALMEMWFDQQGKIFQCQLISAVGDERLANETCRLFAKHGRGKVEPAKDRTGMPAIGRVRDVFRFQIVDAEQGDLVARVQTPPEIELSAESLPDGAKAKDLDLLLAVAVDGRIEQCEGPEAQAQNDPYVEAACKNIIGMSFQPGRGPANEPMPYVGKVKLRFSVPQS